MYTHNHITRLNEIIINYLQMSFFSANACIRGWQSIEAEQSFNEANELGAAHCYRAINPQVDFHRVEQVSSKASPTKHKNSF